MKARHFWITDTDRGETELAFRNPKRAKEMLETFVEKMPPILHVVDYASVEKLKKDIRYLLELQFVRIDEPRDPENIIKMFDEALKKKTG